MVIELSYNLKSFMFRAIAQSAKLSQIAYYGGMKEALRILGLADDFFDYLILLPGNNNIAVKILFSKETLVPFERLDMLSVRLEQLVRKEFETGAEYDREKRLGFSFVYCIIKGSVDDVRIY